MIIKKRCNWCKGRGRFFGDLTIKCFMCGGTGKMVYKC